MKGERQGHEQPIGKPPYPLPSIYGPARKTKFSTRVEWSQTQNGRRTDNRPTTVNSAESKN